MMRNALRAIACWCSAPLSICVALSCVRCEPHPSFTGVDISSGQSLRLMPGHMAAGHSFSGVYASPQSGNLSLAQRGNRLEGDYEYRVCACTVRGRVWGTADGNLAELEFQEKFVDCAGHRELAGRGYLFYQAVPLSEAPARLFGSRVYLVPVQLPRRGSDARGRTAWTAVKLDPHTLSSPDDGTHCP